MASNGPNCVGDIFERALRLGVAKLVELGYSSEKVSPKVVTALMFGSRVYGSESQGSDYDVLIVVDSDSLIHEIKESIDVHHEGDIELSIYSSRLFTSDLESADLRAVESVFTPDEFIFEGVQWLRSQRDAYQTSLVNPDTVTVMVDKTRASFSRVSSNSEVKARKKIADGEFMVGLKSVFHSIRILMFGIQLGQTKAISDFTVAKDVWRFIEKEYVPKIADGSLNQSDIKDIYRKYAKTEYLLDGESTPMHLESRFKLALPKIGRAN